MREEEVAARDRRKKDAEEHGGAIQKARMRSSGWRGVGRVEREGAGQPG